MGLVENFASGKPQMAWLHIPYLFVRRHRAEKRELPEIGKALECLSGVIGPTRQKHLVIFGNKY